MIEEKARGKLQAHLREGEELEFARAIWAQPGVFSEPLGDALPAHPNVHGEVWKLAVGLTQTRLIAAKQRRIDGRTKVLVFDLPRDDLPVHPARFPCNLHGSYVGDYAGLVVPGEDENSFVMLVAESPDLGRSLDTKGQSTAEAVEELQSRLVGEINAETRVASAEATPADARLEAPTQNAQPSRLEQQVEDEARGLLERFLRPGEELRFARRMWAQNGYFSEYVPQQPHPNVHPGLKRLVVGVTDRRLLALKDRRLGTSTKPLLDLSHPVDAQPTLIHNRVNNRDVGDHAGILIPKKGKDFVLIVAESPDFLGSFQSTGPQETIRAAVEELQQHIAQLK